MVWPFKSILSFGLSGSEAGTKVPLYRQYHAIIERNNHIFELMADMDDKLSGEYVFDKKYLFDITTRIGEEITGQIDDFSALTRRGTKGLNLACKRIRQSIDTELQDEPTALQGSAVLELGSVDEEVRKLVGDKMIDLAHLKTRLLLPAADGFVITTAVFADFLRTNNLQPLITQTFARHDRNSTAGVAAFDYLEEQLTKARLSWAILKQIHEQFDNLAARLEDPRLRITMRASVWQEQSGSCPGRFVTLTDIGRNELLNGYRRIIAATYRAISLRFHQQGSINPRDIAIAIGCQAQIQSKISGILHTSMPHLGPDSMLINAIRGSSEPLIHGEEATDTYIVSRTPPHRLLGQELMSKSAIIAYRRNTMRDAATVEQKQPEEPALSTGQLAQLAEAAMRIEQYHKRPQEIEWTFDEQGRMYLLQTCPLRFRGRKFSPGRQLVKTIREADIIIQNKGIAAQCGIGVGKIVKVATEEDLASFPAGAILLSEHTSPRYALVMHKARGIITDHGSPTGHMAMLAREYRVPTLVNTGNATSILHTGDEITLDATQATVYRGYLYALDRFALHDEDVFEDTAEYRLLNRLNKKVSKLHLVDSHADHFVPSACRTYHDMAYYIRVKATEEFIRQRERERTRDIPLPKQLQTDIPLGILVIDAGGGTSGDRQSRSVTIDEIISLPLRSLITGIIELGMWCTKPVAVDLASFMSSFTRTFCTTLASPEEVGRNLAVVEENYMDINLRPGYHFLAMDAFFTEKTDDNYINFRFFGGVTDITRRARRASFIAKVLAHFDFLTETHGDLVLARLAKLSLLRMAARMRMLGGLVGYTRQLDAAMDSDQDISRHAAIFIKAVESIIGGGQ